MKSIVIKLLLITILFASQLFAQKYSWLESYDAENALANRIPPPEGFQRTEVDSGSIGEWLRNMPLKPGKADILFHYGIEKANQDFHVAVVDIDVGKANLQHGGNAVIRLWSEYNYATEQYSKINFSLKTGDMVSYSNWIQGYRPIVGKESVVWVQSGDKGTSHRNFKSYITQIFVHGSPETLYEATQPVLKNEEMEIGNTFIQTATLGSHAVLVADMVENKETGEKAFLIAQSYVPAQSIHIVINPENEALSPWYAMDFGDSVATPEWKFSRGDLKKF